MNLYVTVPTAILQTQHLCVPTLSSLQPNLSPTPPAAGAAHGTPRSLVAQHMDLQMGIEVSARQHSVDGNLHSVWAPRFCIWAYRSRGADSLSHLDV
jgi:hypothetical protein